MIKRLASVAKIAETSLFRYTCVRYIGTGTGSTEREATEALELSKKKEHDSTTLQSLKNHKWLQYDPTHTKSMKTHKSDAEQRIHRIPVIFTDADVVRCMGGTDIEKGHPQVYIKTNETKPNTCKYCGLRFQKKPHSHHHEMHDQDGPHGHH